MNREWGKLQSQCFETMELQTSQSIDIPTIHFGLPQYRHSEHSILLFSSIDSSNTINYVNLVILFGLYYQTSFSFDVL